MLTRLAVIKEYVLTISTGMWVTVQDEDAAAICKRWQIIKHTNVRDMWRWIETQIAKNTAETRRNKIQTETINVIYMQQP